MKLFLFSKKYCILLFWMTDSPKLLCSTIWIWARNFQNVMKGRGTLEVSVDAIVHDFRYRSRGETCSLPFSLGSFGVAGLYYGRAKSIPPFAVHPRPRIQNLSLSLSFGALFVFLPALTFTLTRIEILMHTRPNVALSWISSINASLIVHYIDAGSEYADFIAVGR